MNITTLQKVLPYLIEAGIPPLLWGNHGKGKSETIETFAQDNGYLCFNFRLNCMSDVGDLLGLQTFLKDSEGQDVATKFCMPDWLKQCYDFCEKNPTKWAIIFLDEINRAARRDLIGPIFQMSLDKKLHTYDFSKHKIAIISAANPPTEDYMGLLSLEDKALLSRFCHIYFNPSKEEFFSYSKKTKVNEGVLEFLKEQPEFIEEKDLVKFSISDYAKPDRRKWVRGVSKLLQLGLPKEDFSEVMAGLVGITATVAYEKWQENSDKPLELLDILNNYTKIRKQVKKLGKSKRLDILNRACSEVKEHFSTNPEVTKEVGTNVIHFIEDLPNEQMFGVMHAIYKQINFLEFCEQNYEELMPSLEAKIEKIRSSSKKEEVLNETP